MKPVFIDFHIHTSQNPENLNEAYNLDLLKTKIEEVADGSNYLVSLTDHNTINKPAYLDAVTKLNNVLLGVELHIRNFDEAKPYHCHILFNLEQINGDNIDSINSILDDLYPSKVVKSKDTSIPKIDTIINAFNKYEFLLLPHGGQNHSTFDKSIPEGVEFDQTLERSIYYNYFDGFTARSNDSLEKTHEYFERLGINEIINLVTATDNYEPSTYPNCKAGRAASDFVPTWMLAEPTFDGLRLSLSESSRLSYGEKPDLWSEFLQKIYLKNAYIDIDVNLTPGLNVVIGGSSSGKSLFVDTIVKKIIGDFSESIYVKSFDGLSEIAVDNPTGQHPHYLDQNYISRICNPQDKENNIEDISILKYIFPPDAEEREKISNGLSRLSEHISRLIAAVEEIDKIQSSLLLIPNLASLVVNQVIRRNPLQSLVPSEADMLTINYSEATFEHDIEHLDKIDSFLANNPLVSHNAELVIDLKAELLKALSNSKKEKQIRETIEKYKRKIDDTQKEENRENATKRQEFQKLLDGIEAYKTNIKIFEESLGLISKFEIQIETKEVVSMGHRLSISNRFELTENKFLEVVNKMLKSDHKVEKFEDLAPTHFFDKYYSKRDPKVANYDDFVKRVNSTFGSMNKKNL